jgi:hypothetical protein
MNDAEIYEDVLGSDNALVELLKEGDINILDRGFRDVIDLLEKKYKFEVRMPALLSKADKQFEPEQANRSRLCTKIRWVVESINGIVKCSYRALGARVENRSLNHMLLDWKIAGLHSCLYYIDFIYFN